MLESIIARCALAAAALRAPLLQGHAVDLLQHQTLQAIIALANQRSSRAHEPCTGSGFKPSLASSMPPGAGAQVQCRCEQKAAAPCT